MVFIVVVVLLVSATQLWPYIYSLIQLLERHSTLASWVSAFFALFASLSALFIAVWGDHFRRKAIKPTLRAEYNVDDQCMRDESIAPMIKLNYLLKVHNYGLSTAKNTTARVEKIEYIDPPRDRRGKRRIWYHPSPLNWSGQNYGETVDIYKDTSFYLDFILVIDATELIVKCNLCPYAVVNYSRKPSLTRIDYFWQPWLDARGAVSAPNQFLCYGTFDIYFYLTCDDIDPVKYVARVEWNDPTPIPNISLRET